VVDRAADHRKAAEHASGRAASAKRCVSGVVRSERPTEVSEYHVTASGERVLEQRESTGYASGRRPRTRNDPRAA
jgi:hypothetical protein